MSTRIPVLSKMAFSFKNRTNATTPSNRTFCLAIPEGDVEQASDKTKEVLSSTFDLSEVKKERSTLNVTWDNFAESTPLVEGMSPKGATIDLSPVCTTFSLSENPYQEKDIGDNIRQADETFSLIPTRIPQSESLFSASPPEMPSWCHLDKISPCENIFDISFPESMISTTDESLVDPKEDECRFEKLAFGSGGQPLKKEFEDWYPRSSSPVVISNLDLEFSPIQTVEQFT